MKASFSFEGWARKKFGDEAVDDWIREVLNTEPRLVQSYCRACDEFNWTLMYQRGYGVNRRINKGDWLGALFTLGVGPILFPNPWTAGVPLIERLTPRVNWRGLIDAIRNDKYHPRPDVRRDALVKIVSLLERRNEYLRFENSIQPEVASIPVVGGIHVWNKQRLQTQYDGIDEATKYGRMVLKQDFGIELPSTPTFIQVVPSTSENSSGPSSNRPQLPQ
jgi:hypothetical protein